MLAECSGCGQPLFDNLEYCPQCNRKNPDSKVTTYGFVPWWGWVFVVACGAIPVLTLGGAVPTGLGAGAACAGIAVAAWVVLAAFLAGVSRMRS